MASNLLLFIPQELCRDQSGYMLGKVVHDARNDLTKIYVITVRKARKNSQELSRSTLRTVGYYARSCNATREHVDRRSADWVQVVLSENGRGNAYHLTDVVLNGRRLNPSVIRKTFVLYRQRALRETELFEDNVAAGSDFYELTRLVQSRKDELRKRSALARVYETLLLCHVALHLYPVLFLSKVTERLLPILRFSSLGLHIRAWLENIKWLLITVMQNRGFRLKTGNYALAIAADVALGIFVSRLLQRYVEDTLPSQLLLSNAEASSETCAAVVSKHI